MSNKAQAYHDLFNEAIDYPKICGAVELLPVGTQYNYVSSVFLNGLINMAGTPIAAFGVFAYDDVDGQIGRPVQYKDPANTSIWKRTPEQMTRREVFSLLIEPGRLMHADLNDLDCCVFVLCRSGQDVYWAFEFDQDVSDCSVGRFESSLPEEQLIEIFRNRAEQFAEYHQVKEVFEIPQSFFSGWISF